jgi:hypothetical protein
MHLERYNLQVEDSSMVFEFVSKGPKGDIHKIIQYSETNLKGYYNLGFGDLNVNTGEVDDTVVSNNSDTDKVLATVAASVIAFTEVYPDSWIYAIGSTNARTRLYQMGISKYFEEILEIFDIYGLDGDAWQIFERNKNYQAFLIKRK